MIRLVNSKFIPPYRIFGNLPFSPSLPLWDLHISIVARVPITTMTSADFLAHRNRVYSKTSPGKSFFLPPIAAAFTPLNSFNSLGFSMSGYLTHSTMPQYAVFVHQHQLLQSRCLQCLGRPKPPCDLLIFRSATSAYKGLTPSGKIHPPVLLSKNKFVFLTFL